MRAQRLAAAHVGTDDLKAGAAQLGERTRQARADRDADMLAAAFSHAQGRGRQRPPAVGLRHHGGDAEVRGRAHDRADVVRVLDRIEREHRAGRADRCDRIGERGRAPAPHPNADAFVMLRVAHPRQVIGADLAVGDPALGGLAQHLAQWEAQLLSVRDPRDRIRPRLERRQRSRQAVHTVERISRLRHRARL